MMYDLTDEKQAQEYLQNVYTEYSFSCHKEKNAEGCHRLANFMETVRKEIEEAVPVYKTNCDEHKYGHSCFKYGNYALIGRGMEKSEAEALAYHAKGCNYGYTASCHNAGLIHGNHKTVAHHDIKKAVEFFQRGCDENHVQSCYQLSGLYIKGSEQLPRDMKKAFEYSVKACDMGLRQACSNLSQMYKRGEGVAKDLGLAEKFQQKAKEILETQKQPKNTIKFNE